VRATAAGRPVLDGLVSDGKRRQRDGCMDSTGRGERALLRFWVLLLGGRLPSAVAPHGLVDSVGGQRGAQAELGVREGRVDDERFVTRSASC
jgi:hypothetical protein